jgi:hypothetical protein
MSAQQFASGQRQGRGADVLGPLPSEIGCGTGTAISGRADEKRVLSEIGWFVCKDTKKGASKDDFETLIALNTE